MKKLMTLLVALTCAFGLIACDSGGSDSDSTPKAGDGKATFENESSVTVTVNPRSDGFTAFALAPGQKKSLKFDGSDRFGFFITPSSVTANVFNGEDVIITD